MAQYQNLDIDSRVKRALLTTPLFDTHNDLPQQPRACFRGKVHNNPKFDLNAGFERGMTDIPRLREGAVGAQFWSICVPCLRSAESENLDARRWLQTLNGYQSSQLQSTVTWRETPSSRSI